MHPSDDEILSLFSTDTGKAKAFSLLIDKYQERVYWLIRKILVSHEDSNDVCQDTFIKIWKNLDRFKGNSGLFTWIYRIASNESLSFLKKRKRKSVQPLETEDYNLSDVLKAETHFEGSEISRQLQLAIEQLPEKQKLVFNLRYFEEMKYQEMAEVLETSVGALKASYHHAVKKIEQRLKDLNL